MRSIVAAALAVLLAGCATSGPGPGAPAPEQGRPDAGQPVSAAESLDAQGWYQRGNSLARDDRMEEARAAYTRALELNPSLAQARHNLGLVHLQLGWKALLQARRQLPPEDRAAVATMDYLGCLMQVFMGRPAAPQCGPPPVEESQP